MTMIYRETLENSSYALALGAGGEEDSCIGYTYAS